MDPAPLRICDARNVHAIQPWMLSKHARHTSLGGRGGAVRWVHHTHTDPQASPEGGGVEFLWPCLCIFFACIVSSLPGLHPEPEPQCQHRHHHCHHPRRHKETPPQLVANLGQLLLAVVLDETRRMEQCLHEVVQGQQDDCQSLQPVGGGHVTIK